MQQDDTDAKLVSLLHEFTPELSRLAIIRRPNGNADTVAEAAKALGLQAFPVDLSGPDQVEAIFSDVVAKGANGIVILHTLGFTPAIERMAAAAKHHLLPGAASWKRYAQAGLLMSYNIDFLQVKRRAAHHVDAILKGTKAGDLPVEQPTKFELVLNGETAKALGLRIPPTLLVRADEVIE